MLEFYQSYATYEELIKMTEELLSSPSKKFMVDSTFLIRERRSILLLRGEGFSTRVPFGIWKS